MSRIGNLPVKVPSGVEVTLSETQMVVKGPLGTLSQPVSAGVRPKRDGDTIVFELANDSIEANAMSGTLRALLANMIQGVSKGFEKKLNLVGVGYRAQAAGETLNLTLGF